MWVLLCVQMPSFPAGVVVEVADEADEERLKRQVQDMTVLYGDPMILHKHMHVHLH